MSVRAAGDGADSRGVVYRTQEGFTRAASRLALIRGRDGPKALAAIRAVNPQVRACFMSGHTGRYSQDDLLRAGAIRVFAKPFGVAELCKARWRIVHQGGGPET